MKIGIDAMSGDLGSKIVVEACKDFLENDTQTQLVVVGKISELKELADHPQVELVDAPKVLQMTEDIMAIRRKKDSSMVKTMMLARNDQVDAVVSCGNTGAYYASAMLFLKRISGVERSCLMAILPTYNGEGVALLDVGANAENTAKQLHSFATMGSIYAKLIRKNNRPKVALLNIGSEEHKGDEVHKEAYKLLEADPQLNFVGNIEGKELLLGGVDIVVTDGFTGNVALKTIEGVAKVLLKSVKDGFMSSARTKVGALISKPALKLVKDKFDTNAAGGALMMGFVKPVIKAHGASDAIAFAKAIALAKTMVEEDVVTKMKEGLESGN